MAISWSVTCMGDHQLIESLLAIATHTGKKGSLDMEQSTVGLLRRLMPLPSTDQLQPRMAPFFCSWQIPTGTIGYTPIVQPQ